LTPKALQLYDEFVHGRISRREFSQRIATFAVAGITAESLINALAPNSAWAQQIDPKDARNKTERFTYESPKEGGKITGLLARPATDGTKFPAVLAFHENRSLNSYIEDGGANELAVRLPDTILAAAPYYGRPPNVADVPKIKGSPLIHYAETDARINLGRPAYEKALKEVGVKYEAQIYPGVNHAFHNDSTPRYDEAAAKLSWDCTIKFFKATLM
jgi:dienelactone hydrolase